MDKITDVMFSPNGASAITMSLPEDDLGGKVIKLWNANRGLTMATLDGQAYSAGYVTYSSSGKMLALPSRDNTISIWNSDRGLKIATLEGHTDTVWGNDVFAR